jgi:predicted DNA-binding mobile mystery protein A
MRKSEQAEQARRVLGAKFQNGTVEVLRARPRGGWIRSIRNALGMSQNALAERLGVSRAAVAKLEHAEVRAGITISKLAEVAEALDCQIVYALVPNTSLDDTVRRRAAGIVEGRAKYVGATTALEDQAISPTDRQRLKDRLVDVAIDSGELWRT